jgi:hypothetical protein
MLQCPSSGAGATAGATEGILLLADVAARRRSAEAVPKYSEAPNNRAMSSQNTEVPRSTEGQTTRHAGVSSHRQLQAEKEPIPRELAGRLKVVRLNCMRRSLVLLGIALLAAGCGRSAMETPKAPPRIGDHETQAPRRLERPRPHLIAPPPAYGNKVVMAKGPAKSTLN